MSEEQKGVSPQPVFYAYPPNTRSDDEIDLRELWNVIWKGKWLIFAFTTLFAAGSVALALSLPNIYRSQTLLAPSDESQGGGLSGTARQFGGLASLAGINLNAAGGDNKVAIAIEVLQSRQFIAKIIEKHDLLPELMAVEGWNRGTNTLEYDHDIYLPEQKKWVREVDPPNQLKPSDWEAYKAFKEKLSVSQDKDTGFVTLAVEHYSPYVAQRWVDLLVKEVNAVLKEKDMGEARRSIDYLQGKLSQVAIADMKTVFYQLIEEQTKTVMLAEVRDEYVFSTIDPPVVAEEKAKPKRALICVFGIMLGGMLSVVLILIRHFVRQGKAE